MSKNNPELSTEEILAIVKKLPWYAVVALCGGEPLCRGDFMEIVEGITQQKKKMTLLTNGLLLSDAVISGIIKNGLLNIGVAIDGEKKYYEEIKGKGNYSILMDKLERLAYYKKKMRRSFPAFDWKVTVFPENVKQLPQLYEKAVECGADTFTVSFPKKNDFQFSDCLRGLDILDLIPESIETLSFPHDTIEIYEELFSMARRSKTRIRSYPRIKQADDLYNYFNTSEVQQRYFACREPWSGLVISVTGEVYPCLSVKIGDLKKQSLMQIIMSSANTEFRESLKKRGLFAICDGCCYSNLKPVEMKGGPLCA